MKKSTVIEMGLVGILCSGVVQGSIKDAQLFIKNADYLNSVDFKDQTEINKTDLYFEVQGGCPMKMNGACCMSINSKEFPIYYRKSDGNLYLANIVCMNIDETPIKQKPLTGKEKK